GTTRKWALFLSIVGFVYIGFVILLGFMSLALTVAGRNESPFGFGAPLLSLTIYGIVGAIYFIPIYALYRFSTCVKSSLAYSDANELTAAFRYLKNHYASLGVLFIFAFAIIALGILIATVLALR
ncbi:MAG TPA: hypothetical protein VII11_01500, partial [Bacteroidota bacterium]